MQNELSKPWFESNKEKLILGIFLLIRIVIGSFPFEYGYHGDELYYIAMSHHLDWGYLGTVPPLLPFCIFLLRYTIGNSLFALHLFTAIIGALILVIAWMMVKKMGGKLFAQVLALACVTFAPFFICQASLCQYVSLNALFWTLALYYIVALLVSENKKYWIYFGIVAGLSLMSKLDMLWLGAGITVAMLLTAQRKYFLTWQFWVGGVIALLIASPYFIWIATHAALVGEYLNSYASGIKMTFFEHIKEDILTLNLLTFPIWLIGLYYFLFNKTGKKFRLLGIAYFIVIMLLHSSHTKFYLDIPYYVVLFAGGAVALELLCSKMSVIKYISSGYILLIIWVGFIIVPFDRPVLPIPLLLEYIKVFDPEKQGIHHNFAERYGWEEIAAEVGRVYKSLPEKEKKKAVIVVGNFGEAGAIDFYREKYNLPPVICGRLQYYLWMPKNLPADTVVISLEESISDPKKVLNDVRQAGKIHNEYSKFGGFGDESKIICVSKNFKISPEKALLLLKHM